MEKILIGMSGGVDSAVAAVLLKERGFEPVGVTLRMFDKKDPVFGMTKHDDSDIHDAQKVCRQLGIEHNVLDLSEDFRRCVVEYFIREYRDGRTPNPCVMCNQHIKFGKMLEAAAGMGCARLATGHYARVEHRNGRYLLKKGREGKDQSYMLYRLNQQQLSKILFPLAELSKEEVRQIAEKQGLDIAGKKDSQDICFVPDGDYAGLIERMAGDCEPGDFVDVNGHVLGRHRGLIHYTEGQRKGLGIAFGKPLFVLHKEAARNRVVLGDAENLFFSQVLIDRLNWIAVERPQENMRVTVKLRYRHRDEPAKLHLCEEGVIATFDQPQRAPTPGQAAVFYDGDLVIGGGTIVTGL